MDNLELYKNVRSVPAEAQKTIAGGRLKGMTDINPMWRIKTLTEQFGICGYGWKTEIVRSWLDTGAKGEIIANVQINLYVKHKGEWSEAIPGIGGSMCVSNDKTGAYTDDECYKKAYTDALSIACKALGIGADVYFAKDRTKYDVKEQPKKELGSQAKRNKKAKEQSSVQSNAAPVKRLPKTGNQADQALLLSGLASIGLSTGIFLKRKKEQ